MQPAYYEDLEEIQNKYWSMLNDAVTNRGSPFRIPVFICAHQDDYDRQIDQLSNQNIIVCSINVGTRSGGPIPIKNKSNVNYKLDNSGEVVISKSNSEILKKIASLGGGQFIKTQNTDEATSFIIENIKVLDKTLQEEKVYSEYEHQFQWFLSVALLFILIDLILTNKRINFIDKIIR